MASKTKSKPRAKSKNLKKNSSFSRGSLALFILIFAAVGAFTLWVSFAAGTGACTVKTPGLSVDNNYGWSQWGSWGTPGQQLKYGAHVINYDSGCASSSFAVSATAPDGFSVSIPTNTVSLKSATDAYVWVYATSPPGTADGDYPLAFNLTRSNGATPPPTFTSYYKAYSSDTTPPTLYWNNPFDGQVISSKGKGGSSFNVTVESRDDHAVKKIETYIDGALVYTSSCDNIAYACNTYYQWSTRGHIGSHTVTFKSYDWFNNVGTLGANFSVN